MKVVDGSTNEGKRTKRGFQVDGHNGESHLINLVFLLPRKARELVLYPSISVIGCVGIRSKTIEFSLKWNVNGFNIYTA